MVFGLFSTVAFSQKIKQTLQYRLIISISLGGTVITFLLQQLVYFSVTETEWVLIIVSGCLGVFMIPITSLMTGYASEAIFPEG